jgi:hypothetical protein
MSVRTARGAVCAAMVWCVAVPVTNAGAAAPSPPVQPHALVRRPAAGGIVYARANDIWITSSDGANQRQLTFNGTSASPWRDPTMATDGTIFAIRNWTFEVGGRVNERGTVYRMNQAGAITARLHPPQFDSRDDGVTKGLGLTAIAVSPSGQRIAYQHTWRCPDPVHVGFDTLCSRTEVAWADGSNAASVGDLASLRFMESPSWANESTLLLSKRGLGVSYYRYGADLRGAEPRAWFGYSGVDFRHDADVGPRRLALVGRFEKARGPVDGLQLLSMNGHLPRKPKPKCLLTGPTGAFQDPSWSPDGGSLTWAESDADRVAPEPIGEGIWVAKVGFFANGCAVTMVGGHAPIVPDGETPEWGPRFVAAARRSTARNTLTYLAGSGANNNVKFTPNGGGYAVFDRNGHAIAPGEHCSRFATAVLACGPRGAGEVVAWGYDGNDRLSAAAIGVASTLKGGSGNDTLLGSSRGDRISGGNGRDVMSAYRGNDVIEARDGSSDRVNCGAGHDTVFADPDDVVRGCERVHR